MAVQEPKKDSKMSACSGYACIRLDFCGRYKLHCDRKTKGKELDKLNYVDAVVCVRHNFVNFVEV